MYSSYSFFCVNLENNFVLSCREIYIMSFYFIQTFREFELPGFPKNFVISNIGLNIVRVRDE